MDGGQSRPGAHQLETRVVHEPQAHAFHGRAGRASHGTFVRELVEGATFADGERSRLLFVPSGMETGIKVNFGGPLSISGGTDIVVDFDVSRNFKFLGPPPGPFDVLFTPLLKGTITEG